MHVLDFCTFPISRKIMSFKFIYRSGLRSSKRDMIPEGKKYFLQLQTYSVTKTNNRLIEMLNLNRWTYDKNGCRLIWLKRVKYTHEYLMN